MVNLGAICRRQTSQFSLMIAVCAMLTLSGCTGLASSQFSITPTPASLVFGQVTVGSSNRQGFSLKNTGNSSVTISEISVSGTGFNVTGPAMPLTLLQGQGAKWTSSFTPRAPGSASGAISVMGGASTPLAVIPTSGAANATGPSITSEPANLSVTAGQMASFSVAASGTGPLAYQWSRNGTPISGATAATYTTPKATTADNGAQFDVVVSDAGGSVTSTMAVLSVAAAFVPPSITSEPKSQAVTAGQAATFSVTASGSAPLSYQWMKNGTSIAGATSLTYTTQVETTSDNGSKFTVTVSNSAGSVTSNAANLTVTAPAGQLNLRTSALNFGNVNVGGSSSQTATLTNSGGATVTISSVNTSGAGFSVTGLSTGVALSSGQGAAVTVTFVPSAAGSVTGTVAIGSDAADSLISIALSGTGVQATGQLTPPPQAAGYNLAFSDDFTSLNISPDRLGVYTWYQGIWWNQIVSPLSEDSVVNSILTLNWQMGGRSDTSITTAARDASHFQAWRYGYFEARIAWASTSTGAWPAFWLIPVEDITGADLVNGVRDSGEIDIMEGQGGSHPNTSYGTIHEWRNNSDVYNNDSSNAYNAPSGVDLSQFHTYGVLWTPGTISWYLDNQLIHSANTTAVFDQQTFYIVLGSQEGVNWQGGNLSGVTASTIPLNVDWVRVWQKP